MDTPTRDGLTPEQATRIAEVFTTHQRFIEAIAKNHAPTPDHVQDIVQAVGVRLCVSGMRTFRGESKVTTYLHSVTVNTAREYFKQERRQLLLEEAYTATPPAVDVEASQTKALEQQQRRQAVKEAITRLRASDRRMVCHEAYGRTVLSSKSRKRRQRAMLTLRELLTSDPRVES